MAAGRVTAVLLTLGVLPLQSTAIEPPEPKARVTRSLPDRLDRVREKLADRAGDAQAEAKSERLAQWYNWNNWNNAPWGNWNNWSNWFNY